MYDKYDTISFTPEGTPASTGSGFVFQDVEADVQAEFERHVQFALDMARSADDPSDPESWQGREAPNFEVSSFDVSYGSPQTVQVNARRDLGRVWLKYRINNGRERTGWTWEWRGGERYGAHRRQLVPPHARQGLRRRPGRHREGVVRVAPQAQQLVHLHAASPTRTRRS